MANAMDLMPELHGEELAHVQALINNMDDAKAARFINAYRARRKNPQDVLIFAIIGLLVIPGLQRFILNQIGMGLLYFFTIGLCFIGSIIDLVNYQKLAFEYNQTVADDIKFSMGS
ncbi:TM2 domain family protein [Fulvivirga imtechensis AK7]|uniref:TM2 domain family protein n=1 Tax=Fulvivirga imtechensis AK7 TaxID=1237149 RepID=L8JKE0_9BACT|nr:NINE protein [Fulvivirga imtechensis]ELR68703.1 TM2 domain family protein [Fulvivirga imtechensis AK7]